MDRGEIVRVFLENGYQLNSEALEYFERNQDKATAFLDLARGRLDGPTVSMQTINNILSRVSSDIKVKVAKTFFSKRGYVSAEDLANIFMKRYEKISAILSEKKELMNLISINRIPKQAKRFSLIGMVREADPVEKSLVVEDMTGTAALYVSGDAAQDLVYVVEDEVVGLICDNEGSSENSVTKIVFPDIPLFTEVSSTKEDIVCIFISDIHIDDPKFMAHSLEKLKEYLKKIKQKAVVFVLGDVSEKEDDIKKFSGIFPENFSVMFLKGELKKDNDGNWLPDPVVVDVCGVKIFLTHGDKLEKYFKRFKTTPENMLQQLIRKRHISPTFEQGTGLDDEKLFIDEVPDIFVIGHYHDPRTVNYKGATIISLGSFVTKPVFFAVNLRTRENIKIDLT